MFMEKFSLKGKVAIVTGGGTGLGKAICLTFAKAGADIAIAARRLEPLEEVCAQIKELGRNALAISTDITDSAQVDDMVERVIAEFGKVDILVNNAGAAGEGRGKSPIEITDEEWHRGLDVDVTGAFYCSRTVARQMIAQGNGGAIVNISSEAAMMGLWTDFVYSVAKAGTIALTKHLAIALARYGIRVNCTAFGPFRTAAIVGDIGDAEAEKARARYVPTGSL
ncbi:unnamed protein product, partial [marine sediment metagenome]